MKKLSLIFLFIPILTGCSNDTNPLAIDTKNIIEMKYNNITIVPEDYSLVSNIINKLNFSEIKINDSFKNKLTIKTNKKIYNFNISNNNTIQYENKNLVASSSSVHNLKKNLISIYNKYTNNNFYTIKYTNEYEPLNENLFIKLDPYNNLLIIDSELDLYNFTIHTIEKNNDKYEDINLLNNTDKISKNKKIIIRKSLNENNSKIRISFETSYKYIISIIPEYDINTKEIIFNTDLKAK